MMGEEIDPVSMNIYSRIRVEAQNLNNQEKALWDESPLYKLFKYNRVFVFKKDVKSAIKAAAYFLLKHKAERGN